MCIDDMYDLSVIIGGVLSVNVLRKGNIGIGEKCVCDKSD